MDHEVSFDSDDSSRSVIWMEHRIYERKKEKEAIPDEYEMREIHLARTVLLTVHG